ncbi:hypothetical protein [Miniphocaeibacter massiliensis]|uniref:hypothetical protein n=1 Tax=Miniphocaeibacter massiliensis TaxID=2041841 RepID=UPI000C1C6545|nr:hypothetical protein [Miniphocaeibacter massiliensis]
MLKNNKVVLKEKLNKAKNNKVIQIILLILNLYVLVSFAQILFSYNPIYRYISKLVIPSNIWVIASIIINILDLLFLKTREKFFSTLVFMINMFVLIALLIARLVVLIVEIF